MDRRCFDATGLRRTAGVELMSTAVVMSRIRDAGQSSRALRIAAGGTWLEAGGHVTATDTLSIADDRGIVEYVPGDLTLTARAGTPIEELVTAVKVHDQWLPLDPWGGDGGTVGATLSTATAGPHAQAMGLPRDVALGIEFVSGTGEAVRAGGRVVKNVAGFDLTRLLIGAWGSLGVITEVTIRLRARPTTLRTFVMSVDTRSDALNRLAVRMRELPFTPVASELVNAALARRLEIGALSAIIVRIAGNVNSVNAQEAALRQLGRLSDAPPDIWRRLRGCDRDARPRASWRRSQLPSAFGDTWAAVEKVTEGIDEALIHGSPLRGVVRVVAAGDAAALRACLIGGPGTLAIEVFPIADVETTPHGFVRHPNAALQGRIKQTFDPARILNPGIMGEGADA